MKTISGVKSNVDVWEWGALDSMWWNCVVIKWVEFIHFYCTWTFLRGTYFLFLVSTGIVSVFVCAFRKDLAHFECVRALFVFMCNCAHLGRIWLTLYLLFVCAFRKDLAHFGAEASIIPLCQTWQKCLRLLCFRTGFSTKSIFCFRTIFSTKNYCLGVYLSHQSNHNWARVTYIIILTLTVSGPFLTSI